MTKTTGKSSLPLGAATVGEVPVVTIPLAEYEELLKVRRLNSEAERAASVPLFRRPWWESDPEVADFVRSILGTMPVQDMPAAVGGQFSPDRTPSKSAIFRYMNVLRGRPADIRKKQVRKPTNR